MSKSIIVGGGKTLLHLSDFPHPSSLSFHQSPRDPVAPRFFLLRAFCPYCLQDEGAALRRRRPGARRRAHGCCAIDHHSGANHNNDHTNDNTGDIADDDDNNDDDDDEHAVAGAVHAGAVRRRPGRGAHLPPRLKHGQREGEGGGERKREEGGDGKEQGGLDGSLSLLLSFSRE